MTDTIFEITFEGKLNEHGQMCTLGGTRINTPKYVLHVKDLSQLPQEEFLSLKNKSASIKIS